MEHTEPSAGSLVLVTLLALLVPLILGRFRRLRIPIAAGEILAGILFGRSGLGLITPDPLLEIFNFLGLASLMFLSGMEIDLGALVGPPKRPAGRPAWISRLYHPMALALVIFGLSAYGALWFTRQLHARGLVADALFPALIVATAGLTIIMPVLKDRDLLGQPLGQVLFHTAVLGDIIPLLGLSGLVAYRVKGSAAQSLWILALIGAGLAVYLLGRRLRGYRLLEGLSSGTAQISVRAAFALMFVFLALAERVGQEAILGAFVAGLLLSALSGAGRSEIVQKLDALSFGFLIPIFFLMVGVEFDLPALVSDREALLLVPLLLGGTLLVKALPGLLLAIWYPLRQALAGALLLTTQMSVTIAASAIAFRVGAYGASVHAAVVLVAILTAMIGPVAFNRILGEMGGDSPRSGILIAGMNQLSLLLAGRLVSRGEPVWAVDRHDDRLREFQSKGVAAVLGDPADAEAQASAGAEKVRALIALTEDEAGNLAAAKVARDRFGVPRAILFLRSRALTDQARREGFEAINPDLAEVALVDSLLHSPAATSLLTGTENDLQLADFRLVDGALAGTSLRAAKLPPAVLVVSIQRGREKIVPHGNTVLRVGDVLTVVGPPEAWQAMREVLYGY